MDLKSQIRLHARNIGFDQLHAAMDHAIARCYMLVLKNVVKTTCKYFNPLCAFILFLLSFVWVVSNISVGLIICVWRTTRIKLILTHRFLFFVGSVMLHFCYLKLTTAPYFPLEAAVGNEFSSHQSIPMI